MTSKRMVLTGTLGLLFTLATLLPPSLRAQTNANITDAAFQQSVTVDLIKCFCYTSIKIPAGKRLVVQNVNISGAVTSSGAYTGPIIILTPQLGSGAVSYRYYTPNQSSLQHSQYYGDFQTTVYADTLGVGPAFYGFDPSFFTFNVVVTGYLVDAPPADPK